ncbi:Adaptin ear-binding coat-associated protein 2 [Phytophthora boehmeriae]|uniref:Adaptin ear-binding coat-associated protein 2 n=1 Tax=Phytophthora boehmeriae TaxID=109152 RepID=A0A8T1X0G6_9STRA|nr:Adaptin ear-binding coat-associated protein 2 [Phytophthora boehmeriae]
MTDVDDTYVLERSLFQESNVWFYQVPAGQVTSLAPRADAWDIENPFLTGSLRVLQRGDACFVQLFEPVKASTDSDSAAPATLFAQCPLRIARDEALDVFVHDCVDSSRYFMLRVEDEESGRRAFVGIGFPDRTAAFNFKATLQDYAKYALRQLEVQTVETAEEETKEVQMSPKKDMSLPQGTTIRIHLKGNGDAEKAVRHRRSSSGGAAVSPAKVPMIPPPPGDSPSAVVKVPAIAPPPTAAEPTSAVDDEDWGDFTSA